MTTLLRRVRCDRLALPWWNQLKANEQADILGRIPDDHYVTLIATNGSPRLSVRVLRATPDPAVNLLVAARKGHDVWAVAIAALNDATAVAA